MKVNIFFSKIVVVPLVIALVCAFCSELSTLRAQELLLGDVSGDGDITSVDASMALQIANGILSPTADQRSAADADQDGTITSADAEMILKCAAEKCSAFTWKTIGPEGGTLEAEDLTLTIPPGTFSEEATITLKTVDPYPIQYENLDALGSVYQLEHFPQIQGPITIEISFDPGVISTEDAVYIYQEQMSFITGGVGEVQSGHPRLDTEVDRINGTATIQIVPHETNPAAVSSKNLIKPSEQQGSYLSNDQDTMSVGAFASSAYPDPLEEPDKYFNIIDHTRDTTIDYPEKIKPFLHSAKTKLESLGFSLDEGKYLPMTINITNNLNSQDYTVPAESILPSYIAWQAYYSYMNIKPGFKGDQYIVFTGHELFHIIQWLNDAYITLKKDYQYKWLNDASSTWFETKLSPQGKNYFSEKARKNSDFVYAPLEKEDEDHGYGASSFLTYLTDDRDEYNDKLIFTIYQKIKNEDDNGTGTGALQAALGSSDELSELFREFAFAFISKTTGHANWPEPPPKDGEVSLYPDIEPQKYTQDLSALSAWNMILNPPASGSPDESYKLVVSLEGGNQFIKGAVYTRDKGSNTWQTPCELLPDGIPCEVTQFFSKERKRSANVILVNQQAEYPYDQGVPVTLTLEVKEEIKSIVGTWDVTKYDYFCQQINIQTGNLHISSDGKYRIQLTKDSFDGDWEVKEESALGGSKMAYFYLGNIGNRELKFVGIVNETYNEITCERCIAPAGTIVCVHAEKTSDTPE